MNNSSSSFRLAMCTIVSGVGLLFASQRAAALVIDDFTLGGIASIQGTNAAQFGTTVVQTGLDPSHTLGGSRSVYVGSGNLATARIDPIKGRFQFTADASSGYFKLDWGSLTPLNVNLASGNDRFQINFVDTTPNVAFSLFYLRVKSSDTWFNYQIAADFAQALNGNTFGSLSVPFNKFTGANFSEVQAVELDASRVPQGFHLAIDTFTVVPEPSVTALLVIALGLVGLARFRCKKSSRT